MDSPQEDYDVKKLYPVQRRSKELESQKISKVSVDGRGGYSTDSLINLRAQLPPRRQASLVIAPPARPSIPSEGAPSRKASWFPKSSISGLDGRRQSAYIDYRFYDELARKSAVWNDLQLNIEKESKKNGRKNGALQEVKSAVEKLHLKGLSEVIQAGTWMGKVFWLMLFITCCVVLAIEIKKAVDDYNNSPIATTFTIQNPDSMHFPDVYICMGNALNRSYILQHSEVLAASKYIFEGLVGGDYKKRRKRSVFGHEEFRTPWDWTLEDYIHELNMEEGEFEEELERGRRSADKMSNKTEEKWQSNGTLAYDFLLNAGFSIEGTFLKCAFQGYTHRSYNCTEIVHSVMDPNYFKCFVVNIPDNEKQVLARKGLHLLINSQISLYPQSMNETKPQKNAGLLVSIIDKFDPTNWYKSVIRPGTFTKLSLSATNVHLLNAKRGSSLQPCLDDGTELYHIFNTSYSRTACQMDCLLFAFYKECNCILWVDKSLIRRDILESAPFCAYKDGKSCLLPKVTNSTGTMKKVDKCREKCHTPCRSTRYGMKGSYSQLNPKAFPNLPVADLIQLDIAFGQLEVAELVQSISKTHAQMIADMGGQVNLWLGASMVILLEIPIFLVSFVIYRLYHKIVGLAWRHK